MTPRPFPRPARQSGITLIGMMVGLVISLLAVLLLLAVYKLAIATASGAVRSSQRDRQVSAALLAIQAELQEAGYGVEPDPAQAATLLHVSDGGRRVAWRFRADDGTDTCAGLALRPTASPCPAGSTCPTNLFALPPQAGCTDAASIAESAWEAARPLTRLPDTSASEGGTEAAVATLDGVVFAASSGDTCTLPYAQQAHAATESYALAQRLTVTGSSGVLLPVCLANIVVDSYTPPPPDTGTEGVTP